MNNIEYRLFFVYPFKLELFLEPNEYDWRIDAEGLSYNLFQSRPMYISVISFEQQKQRRYTAKRLKTRFNQTHLYSNMQYFYKDEFGYYFNKLFKKSQLLEDEIARNMALIGTDYISLTFRFQQLLGDFKETGFPTLSKSEQRNLIERCLQCIETLHENNKECILVTSDSSTFLQEAAKRFSYVYIITGNVVHMDYVETNDAVDLQTHLKSFVDFFMIANAKSVNLAMVNPLYQSYFPLMASLVYRKPYHIIC